MTNGVSSAEAQSGELFYGGPPTWLFGALHLSSPADPRLVRRAAIVALVSWAPLALLAIAEDLNRSDGSARAFFSDFATYGRFLVASPLFILAEGDCIPRLGSALRHFIEGGFVTAEDRGGFDAAIESTRRRLNSKRVEVAVCALAYAVVLVVIFSAPEEHFSVWLRVSPGPVELSPAGWWQALVSLPILGVLFFGWLWRVFLWWRLLWLVSLLKLRLIPGHPDRCGGLKFLSTSLRGFRLLAFAMGSIAAGVAANRIILEESSPIGFKYASTSLAVVVCVLFVGPLTVFIKQLRATKKRGIFQYGAFAGSVGWQFEQKWLDRKKGIDQSALEVGDFSATTDLFQVVSNVYEMQDLPFGWKNVAFLILATLLPFIPVSLLSVPFDKVLKEATKFFL